MTANEKYKAWLADPGLDEVSRQELLAISGNEQEIEDRFGSELAFGTGGIRALMGAGSNRINIYTLQRIACGLARYIIEISPHNRTVAIAYDTRHNSHLFSELIVAVLAREGVDGITFADPAPTPLLSYAVRHLGAAAGIVITASHNPPQYNGFKVYNADGVQVTTDAAASISKHINNVPLVIDKLPQRKEHSAHKVSDSISEAYGQALLSTMHNREAVLRQHDALKIIYTPLCGLGAAWVPKILNQAGFSAVHPVIEQMVADPEFSAVSSPNPEDASAYELAVTYAKQYDADLILATDPDVDRVGVMVKAVEGDYKLLNGNQVGALLIDYILQHRELKENPFIVKTIVTGELGSRIAQKYGVRTINTLTGFKYIGEQITFNEQDDFVFGYEESCGYLGATFTRDKDGIMSALLLAEMALVIKQQGITLMERYNELCQEHGYFQEYLHSYVLPGATGQQKIATLLENLRSTPPKRIGEQPIIATRDYLLREHRQLIDQTVASIELPVSNVLCYHLQDGTTITLRPSGTEPKLKIYFATSAKTNEKATDQLERTVASLLKILEL